MNKTKHLFFKLFILLTFGAGWSSSAWADRLTPVFESALNRAGSSWYSIYFENPNQYMYAQGNEQHIMRGGLQSQNPKHAWQFIGNNTDGFKLVSYDGLYACWNNGFLTATENAGNAATFELVTGKKNNAENANYYAFKLKSPNSVGGRSYINPQGTNEFKTWDNDNGCRVVFTKVTDADMTVVRETYQPTVLNNTTLVYKLGNIVTTPSQNVIYYNGSTNVTLPTTGTYDFAGAEWRNCVFQSNGDYHLANVEYNKESTTLTFTFEVPEWYYIKSNYDANSGYLSSDYANGNGFYLRNNNVKPTNYAGIWRKESVVGNGYNLINAKYLFSQILTTTGGSEAGNMKLDPVGSLRASSYYELTDEQQTNGEIFIKYINESNVYFGISGNNWVRRNKPGDRSSYLTLTKAPVMGKNVTIAKDNYISGVVFKYNSQCIDAEFLALGNVTDQNLTNVDNFDFHNMPYLPSLFTAENLPTTKRLSVQFNEETQTLTLAIIDLPKIIHRQHATFDHLATVEAGKKPNNKYIQDGKGLIPHPYAANFIDANGYEENDRKIQNTSVFHLTQYAKKGETTQVRMPYRRERDGSSGKINKYQRWYDYTTERCLDEDVIQGLSGYTMYYNGIAKTGVTALVNIKLPIDKDEIFVGVDDSEFNDYSTDSDGNFTEPSLSMRTIIHVVSAEKMASALVAKGGEDKWWENKTYIVPNIKRGSATHKNNSDLLPLDMPFSNYWIYDNSHNLMRIVPENNNYNTLANNITIEIEGSAAGYITADIFKNKGESGIDDPAGVSSNHFLYYKVKGDGLSREVPAGSQAIIKVYAHNGASGTKYQLAKFTLNFQADCEPLAITSVVGNEKSTRSRDFFEKEQMAEVASLTFSEKMVNFKGFGGVGNSSHYAFPLDPTRTSYAFSPDDAFGGYRITKSAYGMKVLPVSLYERNIKEGNTSLTPIDDDYYLYIDAAESPGQVASIPLEGNLCSGTRLFFYGWLNSQNPFEAGVTPGTSNATPASVILELIGLKTEKNDKNEDVQKEVVLATYLPGVVSDAAYTPEGEVVRSVKDGKTASPAAAYSSSYDKDGHGEDQTRLAAWQSIGFSYLLKEGGFDSFELRIINNCFSTAGGDYSLDDFRVFVNPPKGTVDFTTPLCSDKTRHAKIHADFDMLLNASGVNDDPSNTDKNMYVTCCFLEADEFDKNTKVGDDPIFVVDELGNHNLKEEYSNPFSLAAKGLTEQNIKDIINNAFGKALVGTRDLTGEDHGFHVYKISSKFTDIPEYAYNDSQTDVVYRETVGNQKRIVFKEDVIRGTQVLIDGGRWPHMRPSTKYYLVFSTIKATKGDNSGTDIDHHSTATDIFRIQESCSFLGTFTTKDPMHVILDTKDLVKDMETVMLCVDDDDNLTIDLPKRKGDSPIHDEVNCTSDENEKDQPVPGSTTGEKYKYEPLLNTPDVKNTVKNLSYDWWIGGKYIDSNNNVLATWGGDINSYEAAKHPEYTYDKPQDTTHKVHGQHVDISQAMTDFRFFYNDFGNGNTRIHGTNPITAEQWAEVKTKPYSSNMGYGLLQSEINTIRSLYEQDILLLHENVYDMPLTSDVLVQEGEKKKVYFTIIPIDPNIGFYGDEPYIFCPDPQQGVFEVVNSSPQMLNGFQSMHDPSNQADAHSDRYYPSEMTNVPVRAGVKQLNTVSANLTGSVTEHSALRVPLRGLAKAFPTGQYLDKPSSDKIAVILVDTNDPAYESDLANMKTVHWAKIKKMEAKFDDTDKYMDLVFNSEKPMSEGYTYRLRVSFIEVGSELSCPGHLFFDLKVVPEYQVWRPQTDNTDWTNDHNWARADYDELHAGNKLSDNSSEPLKDYKDNATNYGSKPNTSFVPMYFTNVLFNKADVNAPNLYSITASNLSVNRFFVGSSSTKNSSGVHEEVFDIKYDMNVAPMDGENKVIELKNRYVEHTGNFTCELFDTYVADGVTFEPQTQLINAQHLTYNKAWVEYALDVDRWYTLASPLQNTYAGEWYAPTAGAKQMTPHFYGINYNTALNDRFRPAFYQRSWDATGNTLAYLQAGGNLDAYIKASWSHVYNDVTKEYSNGGFSVKVSADHMASAPTDGKSVVRMPKADTSYKYYDINGDGGEKADDALPNVENRYRLWSDKLKVSGAELTQTITNATEGNNYFLVGNPFIANMDMDEFFTLNPGLEKKYWILTAQGQEAYVKSGDNWVSTNGTDKYVGPLQGFFVTTTDATKTSVEVVFKANMQAEGQKQAIVTRAADNYAHVVTITAERDGFKSNAAVVFSPNASNSFVADEDCQTFVDGNLVDQPTIYTVASGQAMTINTVAAVDMIPVGIMSEEEGDVSVTFSGFTGSINLYDAQTKTTTQVIDGEVLTMPANTSGRYYISFNETTAIDDILVSDGNSSTGEMYNLSGQRINNATSGTIIIINGVKRIIK